VVLPASKVGMRKVEKRTILKKVNELNTVTISYDQAQGSLVVTKVNKSTKEASTPLALLSQLHMNIGVGTLDIGDVKGQDLAFRLYLFNQPYDDTNSELYLSSATETEDYPLSCQYLE